ncbi:7556_t:CDS:2 [Entrophospora sp. SA101]|nr:7556_t:CDS:2 [Entrophospora sp. SA101]
MATTSIINHNKQKNFYKLLSCGSIVPEIHYGPFSINWWTTSIQKNNALPYRIGMKVQVELSNIIFLMEIVLNTDLKPGFSCEVGEESIVCETPSAAINYMYKKITNKKGTTYSGNVVLGFDNLEVTNELLKDVDFQPFMVTLENINIFIFAIGSGWNANWDGVGEGFCSSFTSRFKSESCHFVQKIIKNNCIIEIYKGNECIANFNGATPTEVWKKTGVLKKYKEEWKNREIIDKIFEDNLKKKIGVSGLNWYSIFDSFYEQKSSIIELTSSLKKIYPQEHEFTSRELRAWHTMMSRVGCHDVTPYPKENSKLEYWSKSKDPTLDHENLLNLYQIGVLSNSNETRFWDPFSKSIGANVRGMNGKQRILSIIADEFKYEELESKLKVSRDLITSARRYSRLNGPGAQPLELTFELYKGWALKGNQKYGQKGGGNRMSIQITSLLESFFLAGEADKTRKYTAETMLGKLNSMVEEDEIDKNEVPKLQTIRGWISTYAAVFKKKNAKRTLSEIFNSNE